MTYAVAPPGYGLSLRGMSPRQTKEAMRDISATVVEIFIEYPERGVIFAVREAIFRTGYRLQDVLVSINYSAGLELLLSDDAEEQLRSLG